VLYLVVTASLKDVEEPVKVALKVSIGIDQGIPHAGLGSKVYHIRKLMLLKQSVDILFAGKIKRPENKVRVLQKHVQT
jgi:hypothetical protein